MLDRLKKTKVGYFLFDLIKRIQEDEVMVIGAQLAYYLIMSFFPFLIFLLNIAAFTPLGQEGVMNEIFSILPNETSSLLKPIVTDIISSRSSALLSISLILALWSGSTGINALIRAMGKAFDIKNSYKPWTKRLLSVLYTLMLAVIILLVVAGPVFGDAIINLINTHLIEIEGISYIIRLIVQIVPFVLMVFAFVVIYKWGPGFPRNYKITIKEALIGAISATLLFVLISFGFGFYVNNFGNYSNTYGALGGIIILLIWLYLGSITIMMGAEISATVVAMNRAKAKQEIVEPPIALKQENTQKGLGSALFATITSVILLKVVASFKK